MRRIFLRVFFVPAMLLSQGNYSPTPEMNNIQGMLQYIMQRLGIAQVSTRYLEVLPIPMRRYNGAISDTNVVELNLFRLLYFQLFTG